MKVTVGTDLEQGFESLAKEKRIEAFGAHAALARGAQLQARREYRAMQRSDLHSPQIRIEAWERLHGLQLPMSAIHPILDLVAISTRLTMAEVREEQIRRQHR